MMPTNDDRRARPAAEDLRQFADVRDDLVRIAVAGSSGATRGGTARKVRELAQEAYLAGQAAPLTPAAVADWLAQASWMAEPVPVRDAVTVARVISLLRSAP